MVPFLEPSTEAGLGSPTPMTWVALGVLRKLCPQPVFCWECGRIIYLPYCATGEKNHDYTCSEQAAEHSAHLVLAVTPFTCLGAYRRQSMAAEMKCC